jgi:HD-like signal output (HDOD) protein
MAKKQQVGGLDMSYFWRRSLASSVVASHFAQALVPRHRDEAAIGTLLADIGIPILTDAFPNAYTVIAAEFKPQGSIVTGEQELEAVEVTHGQVSAMVLAHWKLPEDVANAVNLHQSDNPGEGNVAEIARIMNASDRIAKLLCEIPDPQQVVAVCSGATSFMGADVGTLVELLPTIETEIEELAETLRIDVIPSNVYALVAKSIQDLLSPTPAG